MIVGVLQVELLIDQPGSLKDKRRVIRSVRDRLGRTFGVSVAEVAAQEYHHLAVLGVALASSDATGCQAVLNRILNRLRIGRGFTLGNHQMDLIGGPKPGETGPLRPAEYPS